MASAIIYLNNEVYIDLYLLYAHVYKQYKYDFVLKQLQYSHHVQILNVRKLKISLLLFRLRIITAVRNYGFCVCFDFTMQISAFSLQNYFCEDLDRR